MTHFIKNQFLSHRKFILIFEKYFQIQNLAYAILVSETSLVYIIQFSWVPSVFVDVGDYKTKK